MHTTTIFSDIARTWYGTWRTIFSYFLTWTEKWLNNFYFHQIVQCLATIATVYWKSNEESVEGERGQRPQVIRPRESTYAGSSRADRVRGMVLDLPKHIIIDFDPFFYIYPVDRI